MTPNMLPNNGAPLYPLAQAADAAQPGSAHPLREPLSGEELDELEDFFLWVDACDCMTLEMLDGFLHAIAIGPNLVMPSRWLPMVWNPNDNSPELPTEDLEEYQHIVGLIIRHYNNIVACAARQPPALLPLWGTTQYAMSPEEFEDAEMWAHGFHKGVELSRGAWKPLLTDPQAQQYYRPIGLLGAEDFAPDQDELTRTPPQRHALALEIEGALRQIHAYWQPLREASAERPLAQAQRISTKVGRNEPCPCGSGKKYKKCCGASAA